MTNGILPLNASKNQHVNAPNTPKSIDNKVCISSDRAETTFSLPDLVN